MNTEIEQKYQEIGQAALAVAEINPSQKHETALTCEDFEPACGARTNE